MTFKRSALLLTLAAAVFWRPAHSLQRLPAEKPYVILVSIDGFRYDYADRFKTKNILAVRDKGAAAASMIPSFPSVTFPNHVSIVTGLYPEHHGIVGNSFFDTERNAGYTIRANGADSSWYETGTPLWVLAEQQHVIAACMFWPTCDSAIHPTYWKKFDTGYPDEKRVADVINWLKLPPEQRPHFITLYFGDVDEAGHKFGPESLETASAALQVDRMIGKLREGLAALELPVNLILVSDHGMQDVRDGYVSLADVNGGKVRVEVDGPVALIYCKDEETVEKTYLTLQKHPGLQVYRRKETPPAWHYSENPRSGDLVAIVKGTAVFTLNDLGIKGRMPNPPRGDHGYDPRQFQTMHAIFYAIGPNVRPAKVPSFENVNVYPFVARLLGLSLPEKLDGAPGVLDPLYRP